MMKLILDRASATQNTVKGIKGDWVVYDADGESLYELPKHWNEHDVMAAIHFARAFEKRMLIKKE